MHDIARRRRWTRFQDRDSGRVLIVPIDHGLTVGPLPGLQCPQEVYSWLAPGALTGVVVHKGMAERLDGIPACGMMLHLNGAMAFDECPDMKVMLTRVEAAVRLGADAVSIQTNFTRGTAAHNLRLLGRVVDDAHDYGLPVMAMVYDKGSEVGNGLERLRHCMRAAVELGADVLKVASPSDPGMIPELLDGMLPHTPVLFAGGSLTSDELLIATIEAGIRYGAAGVCIGRNIFQRSNPLAALERLMGVLRGSAARNAVADTEAERMYLETA